jgi:hypothetical protein
MMPRKLHPLTQVLLEQRYQQNFLQERIDDGGDGAFSFNRLAKAKGKKIDEIGLDAANFAAENLPFVERMSKAEVPFAKEDPEAYGKLRSNLAREIILARKKAFDDRQKAIAGGIPDPIQVDDTEILKRALASKPELAQVLTRDEYENLAGDITNPLELQSTVKDETGKEYSKAPISIQQWPGIDPNAAIVYDFLRGAEKSLTTPEGLAMTIGGGAALRGLGMGAAAIGKSVLPQVGKIAPKFLQSISKFAPSAIGRARDAAEMGSAVGQSATNLAALGAMGYGAYQAKEQGKLAKFTGEVAGGIGPFRLGSDIAGAAIPAGIKAAPKVYEKGKEFAFDERGVAPTLSSRRSTPSKSRLFPEEAPEELMNPPSEMPPWFKPNQTPRTPLPNEIPIPRPTELPPPRMPKPPKPSTTPDVVPPSPSTEPITEPIPEPTPTPAPSPRPITVPTPRPSPITVPIPAPSPRPSTVPEPGPATTPSPTPTPTKSPISTSATSPISTTDTSTESSPISIPMPVRLPPSVTRKIGSSETPPPEPPSRLPTISLGGESRGTDLDDDRRRKMAGTDINAILRSLFSSSQTISIE